MPWKPLEEAPVSILCAVRRRGTGAHRATWLAARNSVKEWFHRDDFGPRNTTIEHGMEDFPGDFECFPLED